MFRRKLVITWFVGMASTALPAFSQSGTPADFTATRNQTALWHRFRNYRTAPSLQNDEPLNSGEKFKIASEDAFDRGTIALAGLFGAEGQLTNGNRSFGQGAAGFGKYWATAYGDLAIGDYMTEGISRLSPSRSTLFSTQHRERLVQAWVRHGADLLDSS